MTGMEKIWQITIFSQKQKKEEHLYIYIYKINKYIHHQVTAFNIVKHLYSLIENKRLIITNHFLWIS